jgi:hypothetical protein
MAWSAITKGSSVYSYTPTLVIASMTQPLTTQTTAKHCSAARFNKYIYIITYIYIYCIYIVTYIYTYCLLSNTHQYQIWSTGIYTYVYITSYIFIYMRPYIHIYITIHIYM